METIRNIAHSLTEKTQRDPATTQPPQQTEGTSSSMMDTLTSFLSPSEAGRTDQSETEKTSTSAGKEASPAFHHKPMVPTPAASGGLRDTQSQRQHATGTAPHSGVGSGQAAVGIAYDPEVFAGNRGYAGPHSSSRSTGGKREPDVGGGPFLKVTAREVDETLLPGASGPGSV
ncbi:hypothetical protein HK102_006849 [Quaeritorhiza haematococci]|nr:hypothetical protein HK102_006849 [Quaeritorhiza haematococci]